MTEQLRARTGRVNFGRAMKAEKALFEAGYLRETKTQKERLPEAVLDFLVDLLHLADTWDADIDPETLVVEARRLYTFERPQ